MNQLILPQEHAKNTEWIRSFATFAPFRGYAVSALHQNERGPAIHITETRAISKANGQVVVLLAEPFIDRKRSGPESISVRTISVNSLVCVTH